MHKLAVFAAADFRRSSPLGQRIQGPGRDHPSSIVDATDAPRRLFHVHLTIPAKPGPMTLLYPEWIPGEHGPTGPIDRPGRSENHRERANNSVEARLREHVRVSRHRSRRRDCAGRRLRSDSRRRNRGLLLRRFGHHRARGPELESVPAVSGRRAVGSAALSGQPAKCRTRWSYGTALPIARESGNEIEFQPSSLTTLIDSPVSTGTHYRTIELGQLGRTPSSTICIWPAIATAPSKSPRSSRAL